MTTREKRRFDILPSGELQADGETRAVSIAELEAFLTPQEDTSFDILPNGEIVTHGPAPTGRPLTYEEQLAWGY
ncbi:hypothetical protein LCGC14_2238850 [marine sediment metagenome]|uniref:Uncharacterized protein n=1 Tax=marine sediment metagenome TaxID=412755 RepID=A0A0F9G128_9ZZZZ